MRVSGETMNELDARLLGELQRGFPVQSSPYVEIAARCGTTPREAELRTRRLREEGLIRRMGAVFDSRAMGMEITLAAAEVEAGAVDDVAAWMESLPEVTHAYLRDGEPNVWFAVVARSRERVDEILRELGGREGVGPVGEFPATRRFKLRVEVETGSKEARE